MTDSIDSVVREAFAEGIRIGAIDARFANLTRDVLHNLQSAIVSEVQPGERAALASPATIVLDGKRHHVGSVIVLEHRILLCFKQRVIGGPVLSFWFRPDDVRSVRRVQRSVGPFRRGPALVVEVSAHEVEILVDSTTTNAHLVAWLELAVTGTASFSWDATAN